MNLQRRRPTRLIAGVLAGALALSASPLLGVQVAAAADALPPVADPIATGAFCDGAPTTNPFTDLASETPATRETILCLVATHLTAGTTATTYTPGGTVTRRQMALFIKRLADLLDGLQTGTPPLPALPAYDNTSDFSDVAADDPGASAIGQLSQADPAIVGGFSDGTFRPNDPVSRRQMAAFVSRLEDFLRGTPFTTTKDFFTDDDGDSGEDNLNALAAFGIFQGDGQGHVSPGADLTRRQMANILLRDAQVYFADEVVQSPFTTGTNATFVVAPTNTVSQEEPTVEPATTDDRRYTVNGLEASVTYTIQLYPATNVYGTTSISFAEDVATNTANEGAVGADITVVNGTAVTAADDDATAQAVNGRITFTVDGSAIEEIVPVAYKDADADGNLDLNADDTPIAAEPFGLGGAVRYLSPEAAAGVSNIAVTFVPQGRDLFGSGGKTFYIDSNDTYRYQGTAITQTQFDSILSPGDAGTATYNPDPNGVSVFDITTDAVAAPAAPTTTVVNGDAGNTANDVRVTYKRPATNSPGVAYTLQRATVGKGVDTMCGTLDDAAPVTFGLTSATETAGTGSGVFVFSDNNVPPECYTYRIHALSPISNQSADSLAPAGTEVTATTTAPTSLFAARTTDVNTTAFDAGDVIKVVFDEPMATPGATASIRARDGDLTVADIKVTNATFTLNATAEIVNGVSRPANTVLTITLTGTPTTSPPPLSPGVAGLQAPATVISVTGITDVGGVAWNLGGGSDVTIE